MVFRGKNHLPSLMIRLCAEPCSVAAKVLPDVAIQYLCTALEEDIGAKDGARGLPLGYIIRQGNKGEDED